MAALKEVLEKRGVLSEVQARLRAEVYQALDDQVSYLSSSMVKQCN